MLRRLPLLCVALLALAAGAAEARSDARSEPVVEVVVGLSQRPLAVTRWAAGEEAQTSAMERAQRELERRIESSIPGARVRWRYQLVANGLAVV